MSEILVNGEPVRYDRVPVDYMADGVRRYIEAGIKPGSFLTALLSNDLMEACGQADTENRRNLWEWALWLYNYAPRGSYGSAKAVTEWIAARTKEREKTA